MRQKMITTTAPKAATASHAQLGQILAGIKQAVVEESQHKEAATTPAATLSPREYVAAMIEHLAAKGWQGETILQMIERQIAGYSPEHKKLEFGTSRLLADGDFEVEAA